MNEKNNFRIFFHFLVWEFRNRMGRREHSFISTLKPQIFIPPKFEGMGGNEIKFNEYFTKTPKIPLYIQPFILK